MKYLFACIIIIVLALILDSCYAPEEVAKSEIRPNEKPVILGRKLENPFSVKNMSLALENLKVKRKLGRVFDDLQIEPTHLYVRFLPSNEVQYDTLTSDTTVHFVDHPMDYEVVEGGDYYQDPSIPAGQPTYQYTAWPVSSSPPSGIQFETIEELYLPNEDPELVEGGGRVSEEAQRFIDELEYEAMRLTNNLPETLANGRTQGLLPDKFTPKGTIRVWDSRLKADIPLVGAKVRTRRWFEFHEGITGADGKFTVDGTYRYDFNYSIIWERSDFDIRSGTLIQAWYNGPNTKSDWNLTIADGVQRFYAHVFRGAQRYHYGNIGGLKRPNVWGKIKIFAYDTNNDDGTNGINWGNWINEVRVISPLIGAVLPNIKIWRYVDGREKDSDEVFSTTVHELAHSSHIQLMNGGEIQYGQVSPIIYESWAVAVQLLITSMEYKERGIANYGEPSFYSGLPKYRLNYGYQYWGLETIGNPYTSVFIDATDNYNQFGHSFSAIGRVGLIRDEVGGYNLHSIEANLLKHIYGLSSLREKLKGSKPNGITNTQIDALLDQF